MVSTHRVGEGILALARRSEQRSDYDQVRPQLGEHSILPSPGTHTGKAVSGVMKLK